MRPAFKDAPAVLARHGIAADADAETLLAELAARGWAARVEELEVTGRTAAGTGPASGSWRRGRSPTRSRDGVRTSTSKQRSLPC